MSHILLDFKQWASNRASMTSEQATHHYSAGLEKVLEHRLIADMTTCLWRSGCRDFEVLHSEVDSGGYDLVVEARGVLRHIQLKSMRRGGKKQHVPINTRLCTKKSGCVVWFDYDPDTLELGPFRWFGTLPGLGLPDLGDKIARHTKPDTSGTKNPRKAHRVLRKSRFDTIETISDLVRILFGQDPAAELNFLRSHIQCRTETERSGWVARVWRGEFNAIPDQLAWRDSVELAHLIDGYELAGYLGLGDYVEFEERQLETALEAGRWLGGPTALWVTLFLEHRKWRTSPVEPDEAMQRPLDKLCRQLAESLNSNR